MQLKYSNYVAFSHNHGFAVNNSGLIGKFINAQLTFLIKTFHLDLRESNRKPICAYCFHA